MSVGPCVRCIITDASLYREQEAPFHLLTQRWKSMDMIDITEWASDEIRTIQVTQGFGDAKYELEVREFVPLEGDLLEEYWTDNYGVVRKQELPTYAIADMGKAATVYADFIDRSLAAYIDATVGRTDELLWYTYNMGHKHSHHAKVIDVLAVYAAKLTSRRLTSNGSCSRTVFDCGLHAD